MKTYRVEYPGHSDYVEANSEEEAFYIVTRASLRELHSSNEHTKHLYSATEVTTMRDAMGAVAGGFCVVLFAVAVVVMAAIGLAIK